jgi:hypothetical protein
MEELTQGQKVSFDIQSLKGTGKVVGIAITGQPIIGIGYIIEPDISIESESYPYTHFVAFEMNLKKI